MKNPLHFQVIAFICLLSANVLGAPTDSLLMTRNIMRTPRVNSRSFRRRYFRNSFSQIDSDPSKNNLYGSFIFESGSSPLGVTPGWLHVQFPYTTSGAQSGQSYNSSVYVPGNTQPSQTFTFGFEFGNIQREFFGLNVILFNPSLPNSTLGDNASLEFKVGYNIPVYEKLRLRPTAFLDLNSLVIRFPNSIDNRNVTIYALGNSFPYTYTVSSGKYRYLAHNDNLGVGFAEQSVLGKLRLELSYQITPGIVLSVNAGYCWTLNRSDNVELYGYRRYRYFDLNTPGIDFKSDVPPVQIINYDGMFWNAGIAFTFPYATHHH